MHPLHDPAQTRGQADAGLAAAAALLAALRRDFPAFRISHEITGDRLHYIARRPPGRSGTTPMTGSAYPPWTTVIDGHQVRQLRRRLGLSQEALAYRAGISLTTVARLEGHPHASCRTRTLGRLATALGQKPEVISTHPPATDQR